MKHDLKKIGKSPRTVGEAIAVLSQYPGKQTLASVGIAVGPSRKSDKGGEGKGTLDG